MNRGNLHYKYVDIIDWKAYQKGKQTVTVMMPTVNT